MVSAAASWPWFTRCSASQSTHQARPRSTHTSQPTARCCQPGALKPHRAIIPPGHITTGTPWNSPAYPAITTPPFDIDGNPSTFSSEERLRIIATWRGVAEAFAPFDVDVTTGGLRGVERWAARLQVCALLLMR
jgi:hypothetical protein